MGKKQVQRAAGGRGEPSSGVTVGVLNIYHKVNAGPTLPLTWGKNASLYP